MTTTSHITTAQELLEASGLGRCELVRGELIMMSPAGGKHAWLVIRLGGRLGAFVEQRRLGLVLGGDPGFHIGHDPDTVRAPDIAYVRADRLRDAPQGYIHGAPDLAVEIVSPNDRASEVIAKVQDWLAAGCQVVWVVDPGTRTVTVYESRGQAQVIGEDGQLSGGDLLPGFGIALAELFAR